MPLLSIIIPVYNKEKYIEDCIKSVLLQTFTDFELIIVNDGSTDSSGSKCDLYSKLDSRIKIIHQINKGVSAARNAGVDIATGDFVGFVDSDDTIEIDMYEVLVNLAIENNCDISVCGVKKIFPHKEELFYGTKKVFVYNNEEAQIALLRRDIAHSIYDKIYKIEIIRDIHFEKRMYEDMLYNYLAICNSSKVAFKDVTKYNYIIRDNSVSMSKFGPIYLDAIYCSNKIVEISAVKSINLAKEAQVFDFITNLSVLNLALITNDKEFIPIERILVNNVLKYKHLVTDREVNKKHRYAFHLINTNKYLYRMLMIIYCKIFDADVIRKV